MTTATSKLTKAQQALYNRIQAGETFSKGWMQPNYRYADHKVVNGKVVSALIQAGLLKEVKFRDWLYLVKVS